MDVTDDTIAAPLSTDGSNRGASPIRSGTIIGRYVVISRIGAGGMGVVFSAYDPELDRKLALKLIRADRRTNTELAKSRLLREAQAMAKLDHPNVVTVHDVGTHEGAVFIAMEFVQGRTLRAWLNASRRTVDEMLLVFRQAARGLQAAHEIGLVHRDIKPDNIMVGDDGRARVMDFGLVRARRALHEGVPALTEGRALEPEARTEAQIAGDAMARVRDRLAGLGKLGPDQPSEQPSDQASSDATPWADDAGSSHRVVLARDALDVSLTRTGALLGTPAYMAPEQVAGQAVDGRTDQFALCICLFEALHRERPFQGDTLQELVGNIVHGRITDPSRPGRVPRFLEHTLSRGLSLRPEDRFIDMRAFEAALVAPRSLRVVAAAVLAGSVVVAGGAWVASSPAPCTSAEIASVWDDGTKERLAVAWGEVELPYVAESLAATTGVLDDYTAQWQRSWTDACEATRVRGVQSEALLDRRIACLETGKSALAELVALLSEPSPGDIEYAADAAASLPTPMRCDDTARLLAAVEPPADPAIAEEVVKLDAGRAQVEVLRALARHEEAFERATRIRQQAEALGYAPVVARVHLELGRVEEQRGNYDLAAQHLRAAARTARAHRDDEVAAAAETELVFVAGYRLGHSSEGQWWAENADASIARLTSAEELRARLMNFNGVLAFTSGDPATGQEHLRHAVEVYEAVLGPAHPDTLEAMYNLGIALREADRFADAERTQRTVLERRKASLGDAHPKVGESLHALANTLLEQGDRAAGPMFDRAVAVLSAGLGKDHPRTARVLLGRGTFRANVAGDYPGARADFERALDVYTNRFGAQHPKAVGARRNLARMEAERARQTESPAP